MSRKTNRAAAIAAAAIFTTMLASAELAGALAQDQVLEISPISADTATADTGGLDEVAQSDPVFVAQPVVQPLPPVASESADDALGSAVADVSSLKELVSEMPRDAELSKDLQCLAGAIYFESRGEPLSGQLAVGRVIVNRAESSRFPDTYCDVVYQRSQFSFVRGGKMPAIKTGSNAWTKAKAIALIAHEGLWDSPAKGALFFHAKRINPGWRMQRIAAIDSHIFYR